VTALPFTLGGVRPDWKLGAWCPGCNHLVYPALVPILDKFGEHIRIIDLRRSFRCARCRSRGQASAILSPVSPHARTSPNFDQAHQWELAPGETEWKPWNWEQRTKEWKARREKV
jgi:hypothetical protein